MNQPDMILQTLDQHLTCQTRLIIYGRAALALGFSDPDPAFSSTLNVDAILPSVEMEQIESDFQFWDALEKTNAELEPTGLYITHLFTDDQVILSPRWLEDLVPILQTSFKHLSLFRPSTGDLILTKMMRIDPQDRQDIRFLISKLPDPATTLLPFIKRALIPDLPEIHDAFEFNKEWITKQIHEKQI